MSLDQHYVVTKKKFPSGDNRPVVIGHSRKTSTAMHIHRPSGQVKMSKRWKASGVHS